MSLPGRAEQIRSGDPYELSNGRAIFVPPTGQRGGRANLVGGEVLDTDPKVESAAIDLGVSTRSNELRAPDIAVGPIPDEPGWAKIAPPLAVEYADVGQDEDALHLKISELHAAGTRWVWVVRLAGERCVEIHEQGQTIRVARPGEDLLAPGILENPVPVLALYDREAAHEATLRNLLNRRGYRDLAAVRAEGRAEGREEGALAALRDAVRALLSARGLVLTEVSADRIDAERSPSTLQRWLLAAATVDDAQAIFDAR
jgi:hypothetical protein